MKLIDKEQMYFAHTHAQQSAKKYTPLSMSKHIVLLFCSLLFHIIGGCVSLPLAPPGAKSAAFRPGPLVEAPPGGLGSAAAVNSLDNAMTSGDPTVILGALGAVSSIEIVT